MSLLRFSKLQTQNTTLYNSTKMNSASQNMHSDFKNLRNKKENKEHLKSDAHINSNNPRLNQQEERSRANARKEISEYRAGQRNKQGGK
mmetsp:Transcript_10926/g.40733  ORF Transcript_10926/g.40733 Transcript_10926/m.40733 type:complete len:89 (+) Transcript_10926:1247-1513(+)